MKFEDVRACLMDYRSSPLTHWLGLEQLAYIVSDDGDDFEFWLDDVDGPPDVFSTPEEYRAEISTLRSLGEHRWHDGMMRTCSLGIDCPGVKYWQVEGVNID